MDYVDKYFLFERGLEDFFFQVGFPYVKIPTIGQNKAGPRRLTVEDLTSGQKRLIDELFPKDVELYQRVKGDYDG
jgi:hypothetical protein